MLLVEHSVSKSKIHGLGVFTTHFVRSGQLIWQFHPFVDRIIPEAEMVDFPKHTVNLIRTHAEYFPDLGYYVLASDGDYYMNHEDHPTLIDEGTHMYAARDLEPGEELTCDYRVVNVAAFHPDNVNPETGTHAGILTQAEISHYSNVRR